ncbi:hypothetical protein W97_02515 [Coniosporium apollinis CBS 100218]|uniref:Uncharacterized protein n=1 Tax=Coniosporium apollinis (strain CBS 100218) TaxID=1168221 RepID=R7YN46_CONA1|nr:uncharacterized protein W97_02515 [Coniosporium apollinis CBS 100218]EON63288.1 hypothetical protein W97_02515 [Coniosporium apollinis CBS 100218]
MASVGTSPSIGVPHRTESGIGPLPRPPASPGIQQIRKGSVFARIKSLNDLVGPPAAPLTQDTPEVTNVPRPLQRKNPFVRRGKDASPPQPRRSVTIRYAPQDLDIQSPMPQMIVTQPTFDVKEDIEEDISDTEDFEDRGGYAKRTAELRACPAGRTADWSKMQTEQCVAGGARAPTAGDLSQQHDAVPAKAQHVGSLQHQASGGIHAAEPRTLNNAGSASGTCAAVRTPALRNIKSMGQAPTGSSGPTRAINFADWHVGNPVAASIDQIIDEIIVEHRCMLEAVIKNLQDGAPKLEEARKLSRRLACMSVDDGTCEPRLWRENTMHAQPGPKPHLSSEQSSVPKLLDMIEATAGDLGLDLEAHPTEGLHQRANQLARLMNSDQPGGQEDLHAFPSPHDHILQYYTMPSADRDSSHTYSSPRHPYTTTTSQHSSPSAYFPIPGFSSTPPPCRSNTHLTTSPQSLFPSPNVPYTPNPAFYLNSNTQPYEPTISYTSSPPVQEAPTLLHRSLLTYQGLPSPLTAPSQPLNSDMTVNPIYPPQPPSSMRRPFPRFEERTLMQAMRQEGISAGSQLRDATEERLVDMRAMGLRTPVLEKVRRLEFARVYM